MEFYSNKSSPQEIKESDKQHNLTTKATRKKRKKKKKQIQWKERNHKDQRRNKCTKEK